MIECNFSLAVLNQCDSCIKRVTFEIHDYVSVDDNTIVSEVPTGCDFVAAVSCMLQWMTEI